MTSYRTSLCEPTISTAANHSTDTPFVSSTDVKNVIRTSMGNFDLTMKLIEKGANIYAKDAVSVTNNILVMRSIFNEVFRTKMIY